jgi:hypothetical protein
VFTNLEKMVWGGHDMWALSGLLAVPEKKTFPALSFLASRGRRHGTPQAGTASRLSPQ